MIIDVEPAGSGKYTASLNGRYLCTSRQPFLDAARLLWDGKNGGEILVMRWPNGTESLRAPLEVAARLTVEEADRRGMRYRVWHPFHIKGAALRGGEPAH